MINLRDILMASRLLAVIPIYNDGGGGGWDPPGGGGDVGGGGSGGGGIDSGGEPLPGYPAGLGQYLVPRYTNNMVVNEETKLVDLLYDAVLVSDRGFLSQNYNGRIKYGNKKEVDWSLAVDAVPAGDAFIEVDNVEPWQASTSGYILVDPYTTASEVRTVTGANYLVGQNDIVITQDSDPAPDLFTITDFAGCDGADTPATATIVIGTPVDGTMYTLTIDGVEFAITAYSSDDEISIGNLLAAFIKGHPEIRRRIDAEFDGVDTLTLTARFGVLLVDEAFELAHTAGTADPATAPTLTSPAASTDLKAGEYYVAYTFKNHRGQTLLSPYKAHTIVDGDKITVAAITPPAGYTVVWYVSVEPNAKTKIRYHSENSGAGFDITALPKLTAPFPPDLNRTWAEVMRITASYSDREDTRSKRTGSNVLKGTFKWFLGNREKGYNRVDFKFRDSSDDWRAVELRLRDDAHIAKTKKVSNVEINGQGTDNFFQAYRLTASLLAEYRDADFFYEWSATREALLHEEGDVVAITDDGSGVVNLPVRIEAVELDPQDAGLPKVSLTARKFYNELYDDSPNDVVKPIVVEDAVEL